MISPGVDGEITSGYFIRDQFRGVSGRVSVPPCFLDELKRIDERLVVRWVPWVGHSGAWVVYLSFPGGRLWSVPVHSMYWDDGSPRKPESWDLYQIRRANWAMREAGAKWKLNKLYEHWADEDKERDEALEKIAQQKAVEMARRHDLSGKDFGITRGGYTGRMNLGCN